MARKARSLGSSSLSTNLRPRNLKSNGEALVDRAVNTWNGVASTIEEVAARSQSATHDARGSMRGSVRGATKSARRAQKNAHKQLAEARRTVKGACCETARRTSAARDALAGRPHRRRGWSAVVAFAGLGDRRRTGAVGVRMAQRSAERRDLDRLGIDRLDIDRLEHRPAGFGARASRASRRRTAGIRTAGIRTPGIVGPPGNRAYGLGAIGRRTGACASAEHRP